MLTCGSQEKIFQTLPGQGWQVLVEWLLDADDVEAGAPATTLEPVVSWVTARVTDTTKAACEAVIIAPLVRNPLNGGELLLLRPNHFVEACVYLAPGETLTDAHFDILEGEYRKGVTRDSVV